MAPDRCGCADCLRFDRMKHQGIPGAYQPIWLGVADQRQAPPAARPIDAHQVAEIRKLLPLFDGLEPDLFA